MQLKALRKSNFSKTFVWDPALRSAHALTVWAGDPNLRWPKKCLSVGTDRLQKTFPSQSPQDFANGNGPNAASRFGEGDEASTTQNGRHRTRSPALRKQADYQSQLCEEPITASSNTSVLQVLNSQSRRTWSAVRREATKTPRHEFRGNFGSQGQLMHGSAVHWWPLGVERRKGLVNFSCGGTKAL